MSHDERQVLDALENLQREIDRKLQQVADVHARWVLQQAQVHIHEAMVLLRDRETVRCTGVEGHHGVGDVSASPLQTSRCRGLTLVYSRGESGGQRPEFALDVAGPVFTDSK